MDSQKYIIVAETYIFNGVKRDPLELHLFSYITRWRKSSEASGGFHVKKYEEKV